MNVELKLIPNIAQRLVNAIVDETQTKLKDYAVDYINDLIKTQKDIDGNPMPKKAKSTKAQYVKKGYDINHFYIRTGQSIKLKASQTQTGFEVTPTNSDIIAFNHDRAPIFEMNKSTAEKFEKQLAKFVEQKIKIGI